jgi:hypothetical protein
MDPHVGQADAQRPLEPLTEMGREPLLSCRSTQQARGVPMLVDDR